MISKERQAMMRALGVMQLALSYIKTHIVPQKTEREIALLLTKFLRSHGYVSPAFDFIIAAGEKAYHPHHVPSDREIHRGDMVVVDFGVRTYGECTDITRTFFVGTPDTKKRRCYSYVLQAQQRAIQAVKPHMPCSQVDAAARDFLRKHNLKKEFRHTTGHGVGKKIHQSPRISPRSRSVLREGMVITIEPGVYIKKWGGIRVEDMIEVGKYGPRVLSHHIPKDLHSMIIQC